MSGFRSVLPGLLLGFGGGALLYACTANEGGVSKDEAAGALAKVLCGAWFDCDCAISMDQFTSQEQCESTGEGELQRLIDEGDEAGLTYDSDCAQLWLSWYDDVGCDADLDLAQAVDYAQADACKVFHGDGTAGQGCEPRYSGIFFVGDDCDGAHVCRQGTCEAVTTLPDPGTECDPMATPVCDQGAFCLDIDDDGSSVCELLPGSGDTCLGAADLCNEGLTCDQNNKTCVAAPEEGEPCAQGMACAVGLRCESDICVALPGGGEPCFNNYLCGTGFRCVQGTCLDRAVVCG